MKKEKKGFGASQFLLIAGIVVICLIVVWFIAKVRKDSTNIEYINMESGWDIQINEEHYQDVQINDFHMPVTLKRGDFICVKNRIPDTPKKDMTLRFVMYLSAVEVRVDGQLVYLYGDDLLAEDKLVGSGYHFVKIPEYSAGKELEIILRPNEWAAFTNFPKMFLVPTEDVYTHFAAERITTFFICIFLLVLGVAIAIIGLIAVASDKVYFRVVLIGIQSFTIGLWAICNTKMMQIFTSNLAMITYIEYLSLYVAPIPLILIIAQMRKKEAKWKRVVLNMTGLAISAFALVCMILQATNIVRFPRTVSYFHVLALVVVVTIILAGGIKIRNMSRSDLTLNIGILVLCASGMIDILRFNYQKYVAPVEGILSESVLPIGTFLFVILLILSYIFHLYSKIVDRMEKETLRKLVYHDILTSLYNRAMCEEEFKRLNQEEVPEYAVVSIDLNGLKQINDSCGHAQGDALLCAFADILKETMNRVGMPLRMGGDEFVVIVPEEKIEILDIALKEMSMLEMERSKLYPFTIQSSYGYACKSECPDEDAEAVYRLADDRMYTMKVESKKKKNMNA